MKVTWERTGATELTGDWLVLGVYQGDAWQTPAAGLVDKACGGLLSRLRDSGDFAGKCGEVFTLAGVAGVRAERILLAGLGKPELPNQIGLRAAARAAARHIAQKKRARVVYALANTSKEELATQTACVVEGAITGSHGQDLYKGERKRVPFEALVIAAEPAWGDSELQAGVRRGQILGHAINRTRKLINEPPQVITPSGFAEQAEAVASELAVRCTVFEEERIRQERMGGLLGVAAGSTQPPRFVVLEYDGSKDPGAPRLALIGKGITFDSGGLSLKTSEQMADMKCDMAGAATVLGAVQAIAELRLPVRILALAPLAENMPGPQAMKLGDILTARNGKTIEVLNTDAEGRLVLADALAYAVDHGSHHMIDLATLTGSCVVALGKDVAGLMTNNQPWADRVKTAAEQAGERIWQLPMFDDYAEQLQSGVADVKNVGTRWGGAITAAKFLENFVSDVPWAHLDIAGPAWSDKETGTQDGGGTGAYVRTLVQLAENYPAGK